MPLHRMDRTAMTGCIAWPVHLDSFGACGTSVYAVWPEQRPDEPMVVCCRGLSLQAVLVEEPCGPQEPWRQVFPDSLCGSSVPIGSPAARPRRLMHLVADGADADRLI